MAALDALLLGENSIHLFDEKAPALEAALGDDVTVETTTDFDRLTDLNGRDVVVDYVTDSSFTDAQLAGLRSFVADGGGYLAVHCAGDLTNYIDDDGTFRSRETPVPPLRDLLKGHFLTHPEPSTFGVNVVSEHPITEGVSDFEVYDEPYQVDCDEADVDVLARMDHPSLETAYPVVWSHEYDDGRVCYNSLGHTDEALAHESTRRLLANAVRWVATA
ncbi:ThuA domain-containing protein [Halomontanus rarus]|uniref:ThuA domain-containing protein n=1 Tax=Halomontanus rarus TaxID=3034020 RepID=UPI00293C0524|nr:ThuA domain-containing protein [Halovivax sp. KZCA124]